VRRAPCRYADAVAFPDDILTDDESVVLHLHPHWRELVRPVLVLLLGLAGAAVAWLWLPASDYRQVALYVITGAAVVLMAWLSLWPWLVWRTTHYVFTTERVVWQFGIFRRERRDIPLHRVNNHLMRQSLIDRLFGCGTLLIESAGEGGQTELVDVPGVQRVQTLLYDLVDADRDRHSLGDDEFREIVQELRDQRD
jgi:uncharacterized membrane protein YdbT with pleckstrin-like domain